MNWNSKYIYNFIFYFSKLLYLKEFCYKDAVRVEKYNINREEEYNEKILERNIFSSYNSTFCLLQQISEDNPQQYFIFGVKFDDIYIPIPDEEIENKTIFFIYEKTYLFISNEALCSLFKKIFQFILNYKKLNFYQNLPDYDCLMDNELISNFITKNDESVRNIIVNKFYILSGIVRSYK